MQNGTKSAGFLFGASFLMMGGIVGYQLLSDSGETVFIVFVGLGIALAVIGAYYTWQASRAKEPPLFDN